MPQRPYIDFKLYLTRPADGQGACQVALLPTPEVGETITPVTVPAENGPSAELLPYLAGKSITLRQLVAFGKQLANWLLPEDTIRGLLAEALKRAGNEGGVRVRLIIAEHSLKQWPWEYTYFDPLGGPDSMRGFIALEPRISLVRHEPLPHPHPTPTKPSTNMTQLRMVVAAALPKGHTGLQVEREVEIIQQALQDFNVEGVRITPEPVIMDATPPEVAAALRGAGSTYIFHFAGHGITESISDPFTRGATKEEGFLFLLDNKATKVEAKVRADDLARLLQQAGVRLAVLGACYSGTRSERYPWDSIAGALAARDIPAIIAMQYEVFDQQAIAFSRVFYGALAAGLSLDEAMAFGRLAMYQETSSELDKVVNVEWGVPVLYNRLPHGVILPEMAERETETATHIRQVIQQTVDTIEATGKVIGVQGAMVDGSFSVTQRATTVKGIMIGWQHDSAGS
jgi:hypothetical protein